jgi:replicative DNA helicase
MAEKPLPHSEIAEKSVLGSILLDKETLYDIAEILVAEDFFNQHFRTIFEVILKLHSEQKPVDTTTVTDELYRSKNLDKVGGASLLVGLAEATPTTANAVAYARTVKEKSLLRQLIARSQSIMDESYEELETNEILDNAQRRILELSEQKTVSDYSSAAEVMSKTTDELQRVSEFGSETIGLRTGLVDLDKILLGLQKSDMIVIGARPSMGKTAFALELARHAAINEKATVLIFSLEMPKLHIGQRLLAQSSVVPLTDIKTGKAFKSQSASKKILDMVEELSSSKLYVDDTAAISIMEIRSKCRRLKNQAGGLDLVMIDYLQLMDISGKKENMQQEIAAISRNVKGLARELECPVIVLSQLSRDAERRTNKMPQLSDLRDSGAIEQDADVVLFLHRDEYYDENTDDKSLCKIKIGKNRNGETGVVALTWATEYTKFYNRTADEKEKDKQAEESRKQREKNTVSKNELPSGLGF